MEKKELGREDVIEALKEIAFGRVNRGVELTYLSAPTAQLIRKMDLSAVAEFKRNGNGTVEVKFVDRVKALSALYDMLGGGDADEAAEFWRIVDAERRAFAGTRWQRVRAAVSLRSFVPGGLRRRPPVTESPSDIERGSRAQADAARRTA